jgi:two-component system CheB/CheR fusion protein
MQGWTWVSTLHPDEAGKARELWERTCREGGLYEVEYRIRRGADGQYRWHLGRALPLRDAEGNILRWYGTCTDIHERRAEQAALRESEERLRQEDRRKDEFLAVLAHELRNPLAPIQNSLELLRLSPTPEALERARTRMERQLRQLVRLVDDLLDVSRIRTGKIRLQLAPVDLAAAVRTAVEACEPAIREAGHALTVSGLDEPLPLVADPARLVQVVSNLLTNAAKYTPRGGQVTVRVGREGSWAVLRVADTGIGIPTGMLTRVFDLFTQVETEQTRAGGGLGIGLSLVKTLVEHHGGQVSAASEGPGRGSEITVRRPLSTQPTSRPERPAPGQASATAPLRIVVVDDNVDAADTLAMLLELAGHRVFTAHDGPSGLAAILARGPDLVLLDIGLPGMDGYAVARAVRERDRGLFIAALSGWGQQEDRQRSREAGFDAHLVKPVSPEDLTALLATVARRPRSS